MEFFIDSFQLLSNLVCKKKYAMKKIFLKITLLCLIYFYLVVYDIIACEPTTAQIDSVTDVRKGLDTLINRYEDFART